MIHTYLVAFYASSTQMTGVKPAGFMLVLAPDAEKAKKAIPLGTSYTLGPVQDPHSQGLLENWPGVHFMETRSHAGVRCLQITLQLSEKVSSADIVGALGPLHGACNIQIKEIE